MNFTVGERRKTRYGGHVVEILKTDAPGKFPIIGIIYYAGGSTAPDRWMKDGSASPSGEHPFDLIPLTRDVWVNLYRGRSGSVQTEGGTHASEAEARMNAAVNDGFLGAFKIEGVPE